MPFSWQEFDTPKPGSLVYSDGRRHLFELERSRKNPRMRNAPSPYSFLGWYGSMSSLADFYKHYKKIAKALGALAPDEHKGKYLGITAMDVQFGPINSADSCDVETVGAFNLSAPSADGFAEREMRRYIRQRESDWLMVSIASGPINTINVLRLPPVALIASRKVARFMGFQMGLPGAGFPVQELTSFIESSNPQAAVFLRTGSDAVEMQFSLWPISHTELIAALKEVEQEWFAPQD